MSDHGIIWVDIDQDFDPVDYAQTFAEDAVVEAVLNANSPQEQLVSLYENGYLSKREGKMKYLLPDGLEEGDSIYARAMADRKAPKKMGRLAKLRGKLGSAAGKAKGGAKAAYGKAKSGASYAAGKAKAGAGAAKAGAAKAGKWAMANKGKLALGAGAVGAALAARALYKKMKARKKKNESFDEQDIEFLVQEAALLGFDIETFEDLDEAINYGADVDEILLAAGDEGLTETYSDEEILSAYLEEDEDEWADYEDDDDLDEGARWDAMKKRASSGWSAVKGAPGKAKAGAMEYGSRVKGAYMSQRGTKGRLRSAAGTARAAVSALPKKAKIGLGLAGAGLAARALYKRYKKRKAAKNEGLDSWDLQHILTDSQELGFEFEDYESLIETIALGELVDAGFGYYLGEDFLAEDLDEDDEVDVMEALLVDLDEEEKGRMRRMADWLKGKGGAAKGKMKAGYAAAKGKWTSASRGKKAAMALGGAAALGAGAYALKKLRDRRRKKDESLEDDFSEFRGYRSSAQGSVYESAPIPYGTGNRLYERIRNDLLS